MPLAQSIAFNDQGEPVPATGFDYDAVARAVDGEPDTAGDLAGVRQRSLARLMMLFAAPKARRYFGRAFTLRLLALSWAMNPAAHSGKSLSQLARDHKATPQQLSRYAADASRIFGVRNRSQKAHGTRWRSRATSSLRLKVNR